MVEPPFVGAVYIAARSRSGRYWEVYSYDARWGWHLSPIGTSSGSGGGVKWIWRSTKELQDPKRWKFVSVAGKNECYWPPEVHQLPLSAIFSTKWTY